MSKPLKTCNLGVMLKFGTGGPLDVEHVSVGGFSSWPDPALLPPCRSVSLASPDYACGMCRYSAPREVPGVSAPTPATGFEAAHRDGGSLTHARGLLPTLKLCQHLQDPVLEETA